jgi:DNA-binding FadR family transcriptional regulator
VIDPSSDRALYEQVADDLRRRIAEGQYTRGLPSERDMRDGYGVGQHTVRAALRALVAEGLIITAHGSRARVRETPAMVTVDVPTDFLIGARPARAPELLEYGLPPGAAMLIQLDPVTLVELDSWPADWTRLRPVARD